MFCVRNPRLCPILVVTEAVGPFPKELSAEADIRTDLPKYRIFENGEIIDEPIYIGKPEDIRINNLGQPDSFNPGRPSIGPP